MKLYLISIVIAYLVYTGTTLEDIKNSRNISNNSSTTSDDNAQNLPYNFNADIYWMEWEDAKEVAAELNKPIFLLIQNRTCPYCRALNREFQTAPQAPDLVEESKKFAMALVEREDEVASMYHGDGPYIPRIFFLDPTGKPLHVRRQTKFGFYYDNVPEILEAMKKALVEFEKFT